MEYEAYNVRVAVKDYRRQCVECQNDDNSNVPRILKKQSKPYLIKDSCGYLH